MRGRRAHGGRTPKAPQTGGWLASKLRSSRSQIASAASDFSVGFWSINKTVCGDCGDRLPAKRGLRKMFRRQHRPSLLAAEFDSSIKARRRSARTKLEWILISALTPAARNARTHSKKQIRQIADSIQQFGFINPVIVDDHDRIFAGHGRVEAAKLLGMTEVPVIRVSHLTDAAIRAYMLADNRLSEKAGWDRELLAIELNELALLLPQVNLDLSSTGFEPSEIDSILVDFGTDRPNPADDIPALDDKAAVARMGDIFVLGRHRILVGDAREADSYARLMRAERAVTAILDVPYNVKIFGHVGGRGRIKHPEFVCASGEMSSEQFTEFLEQGLRLCAQFSVDGAIHYVFMDWRHMWELIAAGRAVYTELKTLCVWTKNNAGQGSFYRSQHELVFVFKHGTAPHVNTFELGQHGRTRSNVWPYAGVNSFRAGRLDELKMHPTVKPVALVVDAMRDCSRRGDIVLDAFVGSGTTIIAAEQIGRRAFCMEIDPHYVDVCIRRWQAYTKRDAVLDGTRQTFDELEASRETSDTSNRSRAATQTGTDLGARPHRGNAAKRKAPSLERYTGKTLAKTKCISHSKPRTFK